MYKKRSGTIGLQDQLYETKLLSLLNFRAIHDDNIEEFHLAANVDLIGEFDDICLRAKVKGFANEIAVYIQTKHTEVDEADEVLSLSLKHDLARYFKSYLKIRRAFGTINNNKLFGGFFNEKECLFVLYTNAKYDLKDDLSETKSILSSFCSSLPNLYGVGAACLRPVLIETEYIKKLKELIGTSETGSYLQPTYKTRDVEFFNEIILEEEVAALAEHFAKLLNKEVFMIDELLFPYHYILRQVFEVRYSIHDDGHRIASFSKDFFDSKNHFVLMFKNTLYEQVLLRREIDMPQILNLLEQFFGKPSEVEVLSELIGTVIAYKKGKFEFIKNMPEDLKRRLNNVSLPQSAVDKAIDQAARKILEHSTLPLIENYLIIRGDDEDVESKLDQLTLNIVSLINDAKPKTIINIEESLGDDLFDVNGLAAAVDYVLVPVGKTQLMKFADSIESIKGDHAKRWYLKLQKEIPNLQQYTINVKVKEFQKVTFYNGERDENLVKDFFRQVFLFTNQSNEKEISEILKQEMGSYPNHATHKLSQVKADAILLKYYDSIQEWWVTPNKAEYLTKHSKQFENATKDIINQSLISVIHMIGHEIKSQKLKYTLNTEAVRAFELLLDEQCKTNANVIVTDNCKLTVAKLTQYLNNKKHAVLDLEYISKLHPEDYKTLRTELAENKETVIFVNYENWCDRFDDIVDAVKARLFIITKAKPDNKLSYVNDFENNLMDLSDESQQTFLKTTKVVFQDEEIGLDRFAKDENAMKLIKGDIYNKMFEQAIIKIGLPIGNQNYDDIKELYTDRRVSRIRKTAEDVVHDVKDKVQTLYDLQDQVILVTAMPGMGKSTLLTHLSIKTKELNPNIWIVRINMLEYSKIFSKWQKDKTVIDSMVGLQFICYVALGVAEDDITVKLETENNVVSLKYCSGDASITYGFEMFLHFYNSGTLMFLFDDFDVIFPHYANEALSLLKSVRNYPRLHKIWITSSSYNHIKDVLEQEFGQSYELEPFSDIEQKTYLKKFWLKRNLKVKKDRFENFKSINMFAPCNRPVYSSRSIGDETWPTFKLFYTTKGILKAERDGYPDEANKFPDSAITLPQFTYTNDFFATPLHLYLVTETLKLDRWGGMTTDAQCEHKHELLRYKEVMAFKFYQYLVEAKLNKIRFNEQNKTDITEDRERGHFISKHKKLGAYAIFYPDVELIFNDNELEEVKETIDKLKLGTEKSSFIHSVAGDIPLFVHKLIAEYFAAEYMYDLLDLESDITDETRELIIGLSERGEIHKILANKRIEETKRPSPVLIPLMDDDDDYLF